MATPSQPKCYNPRHPERTLHYQTVAEHYETWLDLASAGQFAGQGDHHSPKPYVRKTFEKYLECGIFAHGFARARCEMLGYKHSGFSVDTSVCIAAHDRAGLERLLRYCARPAFALERLRKAGGELVYRCAKQHSEPGSERPDQRNAKRGAKHGAQADELHLTPLELIARLAALVPPPRAHRHRYYGVLAPNSPLRAAAVALAAGQAAGANTAQPESGGVPATVDAMGVATVGVPSQPEPAQPMQPKRPAHILWAVLIACIYEVFPLLCPICRGQMRIIAFITYSADIRQILEHIGVDAEPPVTAG